MCEFQSLYISDDGYILRCKQCEQFQISYCSILLTLTKNDFEQFCRLVKSQCREQDYSFVDNVKTVILNTPSRGVFLLLTQPETNRLNEILEEADSEWQTQALFHLFKS